MSIDIFYFSINFVDFFLHVKQSKRICYLIERYSVRTGFTLRLLFIIIRIVGSYDIITTFV